MSKEIICAQDLKKTYGEGHTAVHVLKGINLTLNEGELIAIVGSSGEGKSTLLHLLGSLDKPTSGKVLHHKVDWQSLSEGQRCLMRNRELGFVYQFHHLLPEFTALENVAFPLLIAKMPIALAKEKAAEMLLHVGLDKRLHHKPAQLSGGERQRVAIARALVHHPSCIFADEPTGNLDRSTAFKVFDLMLSLNQMYNTALVIVTHDAQLASKMNKTYTLQEGYLV